ncbi:stalk domain-containing protein [Psychrobacillus sp. NEAU-3TGS]|uniref:stalk domain-containing protein n=1 Tax=Psychrobacillus sp. NEAU-3TGS TaxID=2995412 RepID=UPI0024964B4C|nr:stalk domain-containing protein [Psychrobacillus sp. NEAU-3TGS]MDI2585905.1 stalk domain-containing protein [Psychrobacillus sp. NEAU-3TGS]
MKKLGIFAAAILVAGFVFQQPIANAQSEEETTVEQNDTSNFMMSTGVIKEIETKNDVVTLTVETEEKEPQTTIFTINNETLAFNSGTTKAIQKEAFQKGQRIDAYYDKNKPMIMIYPAQISPELVIVHDDEKMGSVKVSKFDDEFLSLDNELKLNIGEETLLVNEKGEELEQADLNGKELVVFYTISTRSIPAQTTPSKIIAIGDLSTQDTTNFMKSSGKIKDVASKDGKVTLTVETEEKEPQTTIFTINNETLAFNSGTTKAVQKESFQKGQRIDAYYDKNKPMILIYPAQITPELVIVHDEDKMGSVKVSKFDDEFLSLDNELKLNIGEETILVNEKGEEIEQADLKGKELVVFYTITTMSIPAQTPPTKIIAINSLSPEMKEIQTIIENDNFIQNGTKMIPLQKVAEQLGYEVLTYSKRYGTFLKLGNSSLIITVGDKTYSYNRSLRQFAENPVLKNDKTYVSEDILEVLNP